MSDVAFECMRLVDQTYEISKIWRGIYAFT